MTKKILSISILLFLVNIQSYAQKKTAMKLAEFVLKDLGFGINYTLLLYDGESRFENQFVQKSSNNFGFEMTSLTRLSKKPKKDENKKFINPYSGISFSVMNLHNNISRYNGNTQLFYNSSNFRDEDTYEKNKLVLAYLEIPLELQFWFKKENKFPLKFTIGGKGGWLLSSHTKRKDDEGIHKFKSKDNFEVFRLSGYARISKGILSVFGNYQISNTLENENMPSFNPITFGILIGGL